MSPHSFGAKALQSIGILLMALTAGFTLLGGIGTSCAALAPTKYESMAALAPLQWLYILFVLVGIVLGVLGIRATVMLIRGADRSYRDALTVLVAGVVIGFIHIYASRALRGKSMPVDAVVYTTLLTLVIFLLFKIPSVWNRVDFSKAGRGSGKPAAGAAAILLGILTLTIQYSMASTHTWDGINYADAFNTSMTLAGSGLLLLGFVIVIPWHRISRFTAPSKLQAPNS
jgi:drug/metabolite transporter (DMT)-like permease